MFISDVKIADVVKLIRVMRCHMEQVSADVDVIVPILLDMKELFSVRNASNGANSRAGRRHQKSQGTPEAPKVSIME